MSRPPKNPVGRSVTLVDVGRAAGVSAMAASVALRLNGRRSTVSRATRKRIIEAAAKLGYRPNGLARALSNRRMQTLGVVAAVEGGELDEHFLRIFNGIITAATRHQHNTTVFTLPEWENASASLSDFCDGRVDGFILLSPTCSPESVDLPRNVPFVSIHSDYPLPVTVNVDSDDEGGACALVRELIGKGHRRILHLAGAVGHLSSERRLRGYQNALVEEGIPFDAKWVINAGRSIQSGAEAMRGWILQHAEAPLPHAVFGSNDAVALGCLEVLLEKGLRIPEDVSVAGFGDTYAARSVAPQLTSVKQPLAEMGVWAVEELLRRLDQVEAASQQIPSSVVFPVDLIQRASVGPRPIAEQIVGAGELVRRKAGGKMEFGSAPLIAEVEKRRQPVLE